MLIVNELSEIAQRAIVDKEYCQCEQGWDGDQCHLKSSSDLCNQTSCASHSHCMILNNENKQFKCICPSGKSSSQCQNNGMCLLLDQRNSDYVCICENDYHRRYCEVYSGFSTVSINIIDSTISLVIFVANQCQS